MNGPAQPDPRPWSPEAALNALGIACTVEARENLALLIPAADERGLEDARVRRAVVSALRAFGFTHVAVEPCEGRPRAAMPDAARA